MITKMAYDKMNEYINTIFQVYIMVVKMSQSKMTPVNNNDKLKCISLVIYNYLIKLVKDTEFDLTKLKSAPNNEKLDINLVPFFEYITHNNIELYDFSKIEETDMDVNDAADVERFVLSHIYYLTQ
jgi:hypothetical protein